jgi:hypothetical protein
MPSSQSRSVHGNEVAWLSVYHVRENTAGPRCLVSEAGCGEERCQEPNSYLLYIFSSLLGP